MSFIDQIKDRAKQEIKTIVLPEATDVRILEATQIINNEGYAKVILVGNEDEVRQIAKEKGIDIGKATTIESLFKHCHKLKSIGDISKVNNTEDGIKIYIGAESEISSDVAIIKTKYNYNGEEKTIAIIGPKRMEYDRVISMLDYIKKNIEN